MLFYKEKKQKYEENKQMQIENISMLTELKKEE